jgi:two-component system sensor histidine kinase VicK
MMISIKWRLVAIYIVLVVIVMVVSGTLVVWSTTIDEYDSMRDELIAATDVISESVNPGESHSAIELAIKTVIKKFGDTYSDKTIYLLDENGEMILTTSSFDNSEGFFSAQVQAALSGKTIKELDTVRKQGEAYSYKGYAKPIMANGSVSYVVYAITSTEPVETTIEKIISIILNSVILSIIALILGFIFSNYITKPIALLSEHVTLMAAGDLQTTIDVQSSDEIGKLTRNFNIMAKSLNDTLGEISSEKNKLEIVFSQMTDGMLVFDNKGLLTRYNPASEKMLRVKEDDMFDDIFSFYMEDEFGSIYASMHSDIKQHIIKKSDKYYNACFAKFDGQTKENSGMICVVQDITEHKKLELMQKEFVANVSHELRTPLTTIKSYTETLIDGAITEEEIAYKFLNVINNEGDRMTALVQDLLDLSKLDNRQTKFMMQELELNNLVSDSVEKYQIQAEKKQQQLNFFKPKHMYNIVGDAYRVEQVFKNIISNAIKYSPEEAIINVNITEDIRHITVANEETGLGISSEDIERIFDRFYRVDKARSREMGGTGLGLAIAKEIMEYHGGGIRVESVLEEGTTFYLAFPKQYKGNL